MSKSSLPMVLTLATLLGRPPVAAAQNWPSFRGPGGAGVGTGSPPLRWDGENGEHIKWKVVIPGLGLSSPVVWGERVFVTTAVSRGTATPDLKTGWLGGSIGSVADSESWTWKVLCLDKASGSTLWEKDAYTGVPKTKRHPKSSHANCTPVTDGRYVVAFFGSEGLYCYDLDGGLVWQKDLGVLKAAYYQVPTAEWGFSSSPVIYRDQVIVQCDVLPTGFWASFDLATGRELRRVARDDVPTWSTPAVYESGGRAQLICNGWKHMGGYDLESGDELWRLAGGGDIPVPTPQVAQGLIFLTSGHSRSPIFAVRTDARGDLTPKEEPKSTTDETATSQPQTAPASRPATGTAPTAANDVPAGLVWSKARFGSYMPTPLVLGENLYVASDNGVLAVFDVRTGTQRYRQRIPDAGTFSASVIAADNRLHFFNEEGTAFVLKAGDTYELLAKNALNEPCLATPAISDGRLIVRTREHLFCIGP